MTTTTRYNFDQNLPRREYHAAKWSKFEEDVLPLWVADMDFVSPESVVEQIQQRLQHPSFGYTEDHPQLKQLVVERMADLHNWAVQPGEILIIPGMVLALNLVARAFTTPGDGVLMQTPVYGPFQMVPRNNALFANRSDMLRVEDDAYTFHYDIDFDAFERAISPQTSLFFFCNPHNPAGRIFSAAEQARIAEICLRHNVVIAADEIHADLLLDDHQHTPTATLSPEISRQTVTMLAPSKTYNIAGLPLSLLIIQDETRREAVQKAAAGLGIHPSLIAMEAAIGAYTGGDEWLTQLRAYLTENRDVARAYLRKHLPMLKSTAPEATYLLWVDASALPLPDGQTAHKFFLERGRVALSPGEFFGERYSQYVRLNFACPRATLLDGLARMKRAVESL